MSAALSITSYLTALVLVGAEGETVTVTRYADESAESAVASFCRENAAEAVEAGLASTEAAAAALLRWVLADLTVSFMTVTRRTVELASPITDIRQAVADLAAAGRDYSAVVAAYRAGRDWRSLVG